MQSSLLDRIFQPSSPLLPQHERNSAHSPSPHGLSHLKPSCSPLASSSTILRAAPVSASSTTNFDPLIPLERAAKSLQRTIQSLLDAQSESLLSGLGPSDGQDEISSNGSLTPTPTMSSTSTMRKRVTVPVRQPPQKKMSLRAARRGLSRSMRDFATLKDEEEQVLELQVQEREDALHQVEAFTYKREGIESHIASISSESGAQSAGRLRTEANQLDRQIQEMEDRLFEMKTRYRHLVDKAQQLESSVQSKLSSYNASLELLDKDIKRFIENPPILQPSSRTTRNSIDGDSSAESFYLLNPKRRTLQMAKDHWHEEREDLIRRKEAIHMEKTALEEGGQVWREVVTKIQSFEKFLKAQMQQLSVPSTSQRERDEGMASVLNSMDKVMEFLERHAQEAESKQWKLLICCIGAELEAFREGRQMLIEASGFRNGQIQKEEQNELLDYGGNGDTNAEPFLDQSQARLEDDANMNSSHRTESAILSNARPAGEGDEERSPKLLPDSPRPKPGLSAESRSSESEDDDPGPDFLISHT
ncbi:hypothetical protein GJ744_006424 [Endocarpon pusillum]|uniref:Atg28p n=1 Tax=Endocarpon pusillum TaxID=364733 RepID=A0A8H7E0T7_9EURO|nr:hypothetical protein GJ744_006424 [Endocarpon pusillum]